MEKLNWDLKDALKGKTIEESMEELFSLIKEKISLKNDFYKTKENFKKWDKLNEKIDISLSRTWNFVSNTVNENMNNKEMSKTQQKLSFEFTKLSSQLSDVDNKILENEESIREFLKDEQFKHLRRSYGILFDSKKHILSDKEELILSKLNPSLSGDKEVFGLLTNIELGFPKVKDSKGSETQLNISNISSLLKENDRTLRENAYKGYHGAFYKKRQTLGKLLYNNYKSLNEVAKIRNYESYVQSALDADELKDEKVLHSLYSVCSEEKSRLIIDKFYKIAEKAIAKKLGIEKAEVWDMQMELTKSNKKFTTDEGVELVRESTKILGDEWNEVLNKALTENWISWMPTEGKRSGAYSVGNTYGLDKKFILLNWYGFAGDVTTMAHELGHSMHSYFADKYNTYANSAYPIFNAEVASITTELLLQDYLSEKLEGEDKVQLVYEWIMRFVLTTARQIHFSKFEYIISNKINEGIPVNEEVMMDEYVNIGKDIFNKTDDTSDEYKVTPLRIPHFYAGNFYVYKYAVGLITALVLSDQIKNNPEKGVPNFINYMKTGASKSPLQIIKDAGVDLENPETIRKAYSLLDEKVEEFEKILKENNML